MSYVYNYLPPWHCNDITMSLVITYYLYSFPTKSKKNLCNKEIIESIPGNLNNNIQQKSQLVVYGTVLHKKFEDKTVYGLRDD